LKEKTVDPLKAKLE